MDLSECGTGKTYVACAVAKELCASTLVVCPKIAQTQWHAAAEHFGDTISAVGYEKLRTGRTPYGTWQHMPADEDREFYQCQSCQLKVRFDESFQPCYTHPLGIHCVILKKTKWNYGDFTFHDAIDLIIFDEGQRCSGYDSLNSQMLIAAKRQRKRTLVLSATLATSPLQMRAVGYVLDLFASPSYFSRWASKYNVRYDPEFHGLHWFAGEDKQLQIMGQIRESILPARGVRVTTASIPGFPEVDISSELYDLDEADKIQAIYAQMADALATLKQHSETDGDSALTEQLRAFQRVELLKVPIAVELAQDYIEKGFSIGIFVNFRQTMEELRARLNCDCFIDGSPDGAKHRARNIAGFQNNTQRLILVNARAGGVGLSLPDLSGDHPRGGLAFPGYSAEILKQVFGRFPRESSKSRCFYKIILAAKTGDEKIHRVLRAKLNNLAALNDADLMPETL